MRHKVKYMTQATSCFMKKQKNVQFRQDFACKKPVFVNGLWFLQIYGDIKQLSFDIRVAPRFNLRSKYSLTDSSHTRFCER